VGATGGKLMQLLDQGTSDLPPENVDGVMWRSDWLASSSLQRGGLFAARPYPGKAAKYAHQP